MITIIVGFLIKTFFTGLLLAWGFANGYRLDAKMQQWIGEYKAWSESCPDLPTKLGVLLVALQPPER